MPSERTITTITLPVAFVSQLTLAEDIASTLNCIAHWLPKIIPAERASICLDAGDEENLEIYVLSGNEAIPVDTKVPIKNSMVGRVFSQKKIEIAPALEEMTENDCQMLSANDLKTCMDAPLNKGSSCFGTINIAHSQKDIYGENEAILLQCLANWVANHLFTHYQLDIQKTLAATDSLTGVYNRRTAFNTGQRLMEQWQSSQKDFALLVMDIDHFKEVNDQHGHDAGDHALCEFTRIINTAVRVSDEFARVGGEEFMVIMNGADHAASNDMAKRLQNAISTLEINYKQQSFSFTMSIGITHPKNEDKHFDDVFCRADKALYQSKNAGRNCATTL